MNSRLPCGLLGCALLLLGGCEKLMQDMYDQPKYKPLAASELWQDRRASRPPVGGTIVHSAGVIAGTSSGREAIEPVPRAVAPVLPTVAGGPGPLSGPLDVMANRPSDVPRPPLSAAALNRGHERFDIFCAPCHSILGDGDGYIARRGFPHPPSYHSERLRQAPDAYFYSVISHGYGAMYGYADRIAPDDRWAIIGYIRALQLSRHVPADLLSTADQAELAGAQ